MNYKEGQRVQLHPACSDWMRGDRYGTVVTLPSERGPYYYRVLLDKSEKTVKVHPDNLLPVD